MRHRILGDNQSYNVVRLRHPVPARISPRRTLLPDSIPPNSTGVIHLYLHGGASVSATDYWFEGNKLHYTIGDAGEITISSDQLDLERTVQENAKRGLHFTMKTGPGSSSSAPLNAPPANGTRSNVTGGAAGGSLNQI